MLTSALGSNSHIGKFLAGSGAGVTAVTLTYPLDTIRARLAFQVTGEHVYTGILHTALSIFKEVWIFCSSLHYLCIVMIQDAGFVDMCSLHNVHELYTHRAGHVLLTIHLSIHMIQHENCWTNLDENWCRCYAIWDYPKTILYIFLQLVVSVWQWTNLWAGVDTRTTCSRAIHWCMVKDFWKV
jgi:hypothetical protein